MANQWYCKKNNEKRGPFSDVQLRKMALNGQLKPDFLIWKEGMATWRTAGSIKNLFPSSDSTVPPPLPSKRAAVETTTPPPITDNKKSSATVGGSAKIAGQLAAKQAELTKIQQVTLAAAYHTVGQRSFEAGFQRVQQGALINEIEKLNKQIVELETASKSQPEAKSIKDKAKALGNQTLIAGKLKTSQFQRRQKLIALGKALADSGKVPESCLPEKDEIQKLSERANLLQSEIGVLRKEASAVGKSLMASTAVVASFAFLCAPIGLFLIWRHPSWSKDAKLKWAGASLGCFLLLGIIGKANSKPGQKTAVSEFSDVDYSYDFTDVDFSNVDYDTIPGRATKETRTRFVNGSTEDYWADESGYITEDGTFVLSGITTLWFDQNKTFKRGELHYLHGKRHGLAAYLHVNGHVKTNTIYVDGEAHGIVRNWFDGGEKQSESPYVHGKLHGVNTNFFPSGKVDSIGHFIEGKKHGVFRGFHEDGRKEFENYWLNDKQNGPSWKWSQEGDLLSEKHFKDGLIHGTFRDRGMNGLRVGQYKDGEPVGTWVLEFTRYGSDERYEIETDASRRSGGTIEEFISKMALLNLKRDEEAWMWPRDGRARCFASEDEFLEMFGEPTLDVPQQADPFYANLQRIWSFKCSDGMIELRVTKNPKGGACDFITDPYGQPY